LFISGDRGDKFVVSMPRSARSKGSKTSGHHAFVGPQGAPRGFLRLYIIHRIAEQPAHGYDILREIENKTGGSWRPGAGSIYPILKELVAEGYIKAEPGRRSPTSQRVYDITPEGRKYLQEHRGIPEKMGKGWGAMRRIIIEIIDPENIPALFSNYITGNLEFARELIESKGDKISPKEIRFMLKEYALNLERQLDWTNGMLKKL
jgi:DNA-binding PadR family transcriptional regulator